MKGFKWGIIGPGEISRKFAEDLKIVGGHHRIVAVMSDREESVNEFGDAFSIDRRFTNLEDFVTHGSVDVAYIASPHPFHFEAIKVCLQNKIAVLSEKPIVLNHLRHQELLSLSRRTNTFLMEGMWIRFLPSFTNLMKLLNEKKIGDLIEVKAALSFRAPKDADNRYFDPHLGGGSLMDLGVYCVFLSTLVFGAPESIKAIARISKTNVDEACAILLRYAGGRYSVLESSLLKDQNKAAAIYGTKGFIEIRDPWFEKSPGIHIQWYDGKSEDIPLAWEGHGLHFEIEEVHSCLEAGLLESTRLPGELSQQVLQVMDEIRSQIHLHYKEYE